MKTLRLVILVVSPFFLFTRLSGSIYYVAPPDHPETPGSDISGDGSYSAPWGSFQKAFYMAGPGDTVYFRGGVYYSEETNMINPQNYGQPIGSSGTPENPICYFGYPGDVAEGSLPILDCQHHCENYPPSMYGAIYNGAIGMVNVQFIHFKDLEIRNVFQCDDTIDGAIGASDCANLTFEHVIIHNVGERGYWIQGGAWGDIAGAPEPPWPYDTTRWINCDTYDLCDTIGENIGNAAQI